MIESLIYASFGIGLLYASIYDYIKQKLSISALILISLSLILKLIYGMNALQYSYFIYIVLLSIFIAFIPVLITLITKKVYIYFADTLITALVLLFNYDRIVVFVYYILFLPLSYFIISRMNENSEIPFIPVLSISIAFTETSLYIINFLAKIQHI